MVRVKLQSVLALAAITLSMLTGCHKPLSPDEIRARGEPLAEIHAAFARTVERAHEDTEVTWRAGWIGNITVYWNEDDTYGLCHHWQDIVYEGVVDVVNEVGWEVTGIRINHQTQNEHHAVLVWNPDVIQRESILSQAPERNVYVLDAWRRGKPDIYHLPDWVELPTFKRRPAEFETLPFVPIDGSRQPWLRGY